MNTAPSVIGSAEQEHQHDKRTSKGFSLLKWFSILSLLTILVTGTTMAWFLTRYLTSHMLLRDAEVSREFIESIVTTEKSLSYFDGERTKGPTEALDRFIGHIPTLPDVVAANLYSANRTIIWSSERDLIGRQFDHNDELLKALQNEIVVSAAIVAAPNGKAEHGWMTESRNAGKRFLEAYLPIRDKTSMRVVAVVEIYKLPEALFQSIDAGVRLVWGSAATMGLILYAALFWFVRRADRIMHEQRERLVEAETLSAVGEMAAAVAHSIRNPLASIRSAAELAEEEDPRGLQQCLQNIMGQADRLDGWIRELLAASRGGAVPVEKVDLNAVLRETLEGATPEIDRRGISVKYDVVPLPLVRGTRAPLAHAVRSLISNAVEAMPQGGHLHVEAHPTASGQIRIVFEDNGAGMSPSVARRAFRPLFTTKPNGVGLGLCLSRRIIERHAGHIDLTSVENRGTRIVPSLPTEVA